jgi:hypothetical protein
LPWSQHKPTLLLGLLSALTSTLADLNKSIPGQEHELFPIYNPKASMGALLTFDHPLAQPLLLRLLQLHLPLLKWLDDRADEELITALQERIDRVKRAEQKWLAKIEHDKQQVLYEIERKKQEKLDTAQFMRSMVMAIVRKVESKCIPVKPPRKKLMFIRSIPKAQC